MEKKSQPVPSRTDNKVSGDFLFPDIWKQYDQGKYAEVLALASAQLENSSREARLEANKLMGGAYLQQGKYEESVPYFEKASIGSNKVSDWSNLAISATLAQQIEKGTSAFDHAVDIQLKTGHKQQPSIPWMRLWYASALRDIGEYQRAIEQINELRSLYELAHITDPTFLHIRGVPFLDDTMKVAMDVFKGLGPTFDAKTWIAAFSEKLDEQGQGYLSKLKDGL